MTRAPWPLSDWAHPLPTSPYPQTTATLPLSITSVARISPSTSEWRQPYRLSNLLLVTESLTLMAGNRSVPAFSISYRRWTPVVVSSLTPWHSAATFVHRCGVSRTVLASSCRMTLNSSLSVVSGPGTTPAFSNSTPLWMSSVASPPSSTIWLGPNGKPFGPSPKSRARSVHHQYSSSVSPFQAKTGTPRGLLTVPPASGRPTATAAAAWSWVLKMLHEHHRTSAPRADSVSIRTAVWIVMCSEPMTRRPLSGWRLAYSARTAIRPGISCSASMISLRPQSASDRSATLNSRDPAAGVAWVAGL